MNAKSQRLPRTFLDTNILLYCDDSASQTKQAKAQELVIQGVFRSLIRPVRA